METTKPPLEEKVETDFTKKTSSVHQNTITQPLTIAQIAQTTQSAQKAQDAIVGGRLHHFWKVWKALGVKESVVDILKNGLKWEFTEKPRLRTKQWNAQCWMSRKKREGMTPVIQKLLEEDTIEEVTKLDSPGFYSILFLRSKISGETRPIIYLKLLNKIIVNKTFRMESAKTIQSAMDPN